MIDHRYMIELSDDLATGTAREPLESTTYGDTTESRLRPFSSPTAVQLKSIEGDTRRIGGSIAQGDLIDRTRMTLEAQR